MEHSEVAFVQFLQEYGINICPDSGDISYVDGKARCGIHTVDDGGESDDEDVPYL